MWVHLRKYQYHGIRLQVKLRLKRHQRHIQITRGNYWDSPPAITIKYDLCYRLHRCCQVLHMFGNYVKQALYCTEKSQVIHFCFFFLLYVLLFKSLLYSFSPITRSMQTTVTFTLHAYDLTWYMWHHWIVLRTSGNNF